MKVHHLILPFLIATIFLSLIPVYAQNSSFQIRYPRIMGLLPEAPIYFQENKVGEVKNIFYTRDGDYLVSVEIDEMFVNTATSHSSFYISHSPEPPEGIVLRIVQKEPGGTPIADGNIVEGQGEYSPVDEFIATFREKNGLSREEIKQRLEKIHQSLKNTSLHIGNSLEYILYKLDIQLQMYSEKFESLPDHEQIQRLKSTIAELEREMQKTQDDVRNHIKTVVIPKLQSQLDALRKRFAGQNSEDEIVEIDTMQEQLNQMITI